MKLKDDQITKRLVKADLVKALILEGINKAHTFEYVKPTDRVISILTCVEREFRLSFKNYSEWSRLKADQKLKAQLGLYDAYHPRDPEPELIHRCDNCDKMLSDDDLAHAWPDIPDLGMRTSPGNPIPSGECSQCGALTYTTEADLDN